MKRHLLMLLVALMATVMSLEARTVVIDEGFENGIQATEWTQEFVSGDMPWAVESNEGDLAYPATVFQGSKRAYLRNTTGETMGYKTRLVSKVMDLRPTKVYMPELVFWYANPKWGGDRDTLRVLYRTGARAAWKQLAEFSTAAPDWQRVKLSLPEVNSTYQIAFEGADNLGRGIVLDSIKLQSAPECTVPEELVATNKGAGKVNLAWVASYDADYFELIVSRDTIDPDLIADIELETPEKIVYHGLISDATSKDLSLESGEFYLAYVRSICENENSAWSSEQSKDGPFGFRVRVAKQIPFFENFNYTSYNRDPDWTWGSNTGNTNPFVNYTLSSKQRANYSPDGTPAVVFSGGTLSQMTAVIPADKYVYMATPALADSLNDDFVVSQCQVHFWSTVYSNTGRKYGRSLMVGVMEDPEDISTFVPVDTVSVWGNMTFQENIVDLSSYTGSGSYVAFVSDFDRDNLFYIDNLTIEYRKAVNKVTKVSVNPRDTYATITWEGNASSYNVLVTNAEVDPANPDNAAVVDQATVTTNSYLCEVLEADHSWNRPYYVYVQAAGTEWSYRYPFVTIASQRDIPYAYSFDAATTSKYSIPSTGTAEYATGIGIFGNSGGYPSVEVGSDKSYIGTGYLFLSQLGGKDSWITLPMVENLDEVQIKFYLSGGTTFDQAHAKVGVMSNPMDINTFIPVADYQLNTTGYTRCYANFQNYSGPDGVIAIVWGDVMNMSKNTINYIDELVVEELSDCVPPTNINLDVLPDSVTVSWEASALSDEWEIFISRTALTERQRAGKTLEEIQALPGVEVAQTITWPGTSSPQFGFGQLTPHANYYLYVRATCDLTWWSELSFSTPCRDEEYPYKETFENYNIGSTSVGCWQLADYMGVDYPSVYQAGTSLSSNKTLELYSSGTTHRSVAILPKVEGNLSDMLLSFDVRATSTTSTAVVYVGTMGDINDASSFVPFDTVEVTSTSTFQKARFILSNYVLAHDNIAITSGLGTLAKNSDILIDNVELKDPSCIEAYDLRQTNYEPTEIDLVWNGQADNDRWEIKVLTVSASLSSVKNGTYNASAVVVDDTIVTGKHFHLNDLQAQRTYYVYIRTLCGDSVWTVTPAQTSCELLDPTKPNKETFESYAENTTPKCWMVGTRTGTGTNPYISTAGGSKVFHIHQSTTTSPSWIASPEIKCDTLTSILVSFDVSTYSGETCVLGVMTDPMDLSTFVALDSLSGTGSSNFISRSYDLSDYAALIPPTAKYIAWRGKYNDDDWVYLDNISFVSVACPITKPSISELTTSSVRVSSGLRTDDQWILLITDRAVSADDLAREEYVVPESWVVYRDTIDRRSKEVFNLQGQTKYYIATATLCEDSVVSLWTTMSFMTPCQATTPEAMGTIIFDEKNGYSTGTSGEMPCWTVGSKTRDAALTYIPHLEASAATMHGEHNYLQIYDYVTSSVNAVGGYAIMPELDVDSISKYQVNFWGRSYNSSSYNNQLIVGVITDPTDLNTFVAVDTVNLSKTTWDPYSIGFENYESDYMGDVGRHIMFLSDFGMTNYAYISEISVELIPSCRPISSFTVDSVGEAAAIVSWKGYQDTYRLLVAPKALQDSEKPGYRYLLDTIVDHSDNVLITNLSPTSDYYVYAQGVCEVGDSTAISMTYAYIRTTCPTVGGSPLPFSEDFENYKANDQTFGCWQTIDYRGSGYPKILNLTSGAQSGLQLELWTTSSGHSCVVMPPAIDADLADCRLTFDSRSWSSSSSSTLYVGTMADINDPNTFEPFYVVNNPNGSTFTHVVLDLSEYELIYDNLAFSSGLGTTSSDVMIDNILIERAATCGAPRLKSISTSYNAAEVAITPALKTDSLWEVVLISEAEYLSIGDITSYLETVKKTRLDSTHIIFSDLAQATSYYVYARTICSSEDVSAWVRNPLKLTTQYYFADNYLFGFEKKGETWERSTYSVSDNYYLHPALVAGRDSLGEESQSYLYYPHSMENTDNYSYSRTSAGALLMHAADDFYGGYIIFPALEEPTARSFEFKARSGYLNIQNSYKPMDSQDALLEVGTIDKDRDFSTYQPLATIRLDQLASNKQGSSRNNYLYSNYSLDLDSMTVATKQLVLHMPKQPHDSTYLFIDDVKMEASKNFSLVALKKVQADGESALIEWYDIGGPWNLTVKDASGKTVATYPNLSGVTSQLVEGLESRTDYTVTLAAASVPSGASSYVTTAKMSFRTLCPTFELSETERSYEWNFDQTYDWEPNDVLGGDAYDSLYLKQACFQVGVTCSKPVNGTQWLIQRKGYEPTGALAGYSASRFHEVGRDDSYALRVHTTDASYHSYIVLPQINCDLDTMMVEFYGRCFVNYNQNYTTASNRGRIVDATYLGSAYSHSIVVGTLTDPTDFSTLHVIDTLTYSHTELTYNDNVNNDPAGLRYWELMHLPLEGAQGKYIVLFQPAPGLFYLDNLSVKPVGNTMFAPTRTATTNITSSSATLSWFTRHPEWNTVVVLLNAMGEEVYRDTVTGTTYELSDLQAAMTYEWYVYQTNENDSSPATKPERFETGCVVVTPAYTCGFEKEEGWKQIDGQSASYLQTLCWTYSDAIQDEWKSATYDPYNQTNTDNYAYTYAGSRALVMRASYSSRGASYQPYIAMPAMDVATYDTLQVSFWMRPAYVSAVDGTVISSYTGTTYSKSIIVGTMTDPTDAATFVPLDTVTYDGAISTADVATAANNFLFQQMKVELGGARGPYVAFMTSFHEKGGSSLKSGDYIWLDDISFEHRQECKAPTELLALRIGTYDAELTWNGIDSAGYYLLQVSTDPYFADESAFVYNGVVESNTYTVDGLESLTTYVWRVQALCGEKWGDSNFSQKATFKTSRSPYFLEPFTSIVDANEWTFSKAHAENVVDGTGALTKAIDSWSFARTSSNNGLQGPHYMASGYSADYHWMVTPNFYLPLDDSVHFSMDLALTACNTAHTATGNAVTENDMKDDYYFMIIISDDGGRTWKSENILAKWQNTNPAGQQLRDIPATGKTVRYSLAAYAGKNIRIGLYREAKTASTTGIAIHVDNVRLAYFDKTVDYTSACQYEDVVIGDIILSGDDTEPGIHAYPNCFYATDAEARAGKRDSVQQLEIEVFAAQQTLFVDTICAGETYSDINFHGKETTGVYRRKMESQHGCDSTILLNLYVIPRAYAEDVQVALCPGETYMWNDKPYNRAGIFRDTLVSAAGCDSIETLIVSYAAAEDSIFVESRVEISELPFTYENAQYPYIVGQAPIYYAAGTPKGVYVDYVRVEGVSCPRVLVHTLTIYDEHEAIDLISTETEGARKVIINDNLYIILNDEWYNAAGLKVADPRR